MATPDFDSIPLLQRALEKGNALLSTNLVAIEAKTGWETSAEHAILTVFGPDSPYLQKFKYRRRYAGAIPDSREVVARRKQELRERVAIVAELLEAAQHHNQILAAALRAQTIQPSNVIIEKTSVMPSAKPRGFIASSVQGLEVAHDVQANLEHDFEMIVWDQGTFGATQYPIESLLKELDDCNFGIFIFTPDDTVHIGKNAVGPKVTVRDNVILEMGLFLGRLGRERVFFIQPRDVPDFRLASDLSGLTPLTYDQNRSDGNIQAALGTACNQIRKQVKKLGPPN